MKACTRPGCPTLIHDHELACKPDWLALPISLRNRIWRAYRRGHTAAHRRAVLEAVAVWDPPPPPPLRCHSCRRVTDLVDVEANRGICEICALAEIGRGRPDLEACAGCGRMVEVLVSVDHRPPRLCLDCLIAVAETPSAV